MSNVPVIKFLFRSEWKVLSEALKLNPIYESDEFDAANDLTTYLSGVPAGLIVACLFDKKDLIQIATFLKQSKNFPGNCFKIMIVNFSGDKQFDKAVGKLGVLDLVDAKIPTKALKFKMDFMMKSLNAQVKKNAAAETANNSVKSLDQNKAQDKKIQENTPIWKDALDCEDDVWILKNEIDCKKILTRWLIKFMGPSPYVAQWVDSGTPGIWKFEFKSESEEFIFGKGNWFFRGEQKPDFVWNENLWLFTGSSFDLFYKSGNDISSRVNLKDKSLNISKNSEYAKTKEKRIIESFDKELVFKKDKTDDGNVEKIDKDQEKYKNLEGKGKTDVVNKGPLSGKGKTSNLSSDPLSMDLKPGENNTSSDPLSQKANTTKESSFWNGKNAYEKDDKKADFSAPKDKNVNSGAELSLENKNKHEKFYKNHNEAEKFDAKDLSGKSSTSEIEGHLTSPDAKKEREQKERNNQNELNGKSSTDTLDGHLTSANARKEKEQKEARERDLSGKTSTDKMPGHLSSPDGKREIQEKAGKDLNGKSSTEKMPGHLSSPDALQEQKKKENEQKKGLLSDSSTDELDDDGDESSDESQAKLTDFTKRKEQKEKANLALAAEEAKKEKAEKQSAAAVAEKNKKEKEEKNNNLNEKNGNELSGKSNTDKLDGHLSSSNRKEKQQKEANESNELNGKTSTEKMNGHLSSPERDSQKDGKAADLKKERSGNQSASELDDDGDELSNDVKGNRPARERSSATGASRDKNTTEIEELSELSDSQLDDVASKVLPFEKEISAVLNKEVSREVSDSIQSAKVTAFLIQDSLKIRCQLDDYYDQTIIFSAETVGIDKAQPVELNLNFNYLNKDTSLKFNGEVLSIEPDGEGSHFVTVQISPENEQAFNSFMKLYVTRQDNIDLFLKTAKGY